MKAIFWMAMLGWMLALASPTIAQTADAAAGKVKYDQLCAGCHGLTGVGDGPAAAALNPKPRNFADKAAMSIKTDDQLKKVIAEGGTAVGLSPLMPPWKASLSEADIANVLAYIRQMAK